MKHKRITINKRIIIIGMLIVGLGYTAISAIVFASNEKYVHDETCGYVEAVEAASCTHEHNEACYTPELNCQHVHDEFCGYREAVEGQPCQADPVVAPPTTADPVDSEDHDCINEGVPKCTCGTLTDEHDEDCPLYNGPYCSCGNPGGPHDESCPLWQEPIYTAISERIDGLPALAEVQAMDLVEVQKVHVEILAIRDMIIEQTAGITDAEEFVRFDMELGEERLEKYNSILLYTDAYIDRNVANEAQPRLLSASFAFTGLGLGIAPTRGFSDATPVDISVGRVVFETKTSYGVTYGGTQYNGTSSAVINNLELNTEYRIYGTYTNTASGYGATSNTIIRVAEGQTVTLYFGDPTNSNASKRDLNITNINTNASDTYQNTGFICVDVTDSNTTIVLMDGTTTTLKGGKRESGGALVKNGMKDYSLTIQCQHWDEPGHLCKGSADEAPAANQCGKLVAEGIQRHSAAIGSSRDAIERWDVYGGGNGGFANLYIKGGIIKAWNSSPEGSDTTNSHSPGIGSMCGTSFVSDGMTTFSNPQMDKGQICKNITISGGRIYAFGGNNCAGIGSGGWGGPVDGIYISGGAYVYAKGGTNSPGIGSGGGAEKFQGVKSPAYNVSNIVVTGGRTVVEAVGDKSTTYLPTGYNSVPGIGCGISMNGTGRINGVLTNVVATPINDDWMALVRQGTEKMTSVYIPGAPSANSLPIIPNMYYTLVHFSGVSKDARVSKDNGATWGPIQRGTETAPIQVKVGDRIEYTLDTANYTIETPNYNIADQIPSGLSLVTEADSYTPGMTWSTVGGVTTVRWLNQVTSGRFTFTVVVDELQGDGERTYMNEAIVSAAGELDMPSTRTYHYAEGYADLIFHKIKNDSTSPLEGAKFELYKCTNTTHISSGNHNSGGCTWDAASRYRTEQQSGADGRVEFTRLPHDFSYILVETAAPADWMLPGTGSYVLVSIGTNGSITMTGYGDFSSGAIMGPTTTPYQDYYKIKNAPMAVDIRVKKVVGNYGSLSPEQQTEILSRPFTIKLSGGANGSITLKHDEISPTMNVIISALTASVDVTETVPMEFSPDYTVSALITHADGTTETKNGKAITITPGDDVLITVTNTFTQKPFFKGWDWIENLFQ